MNQSADEILRSCDAAGPASPELIASAESKLNLRFPSTYRGFLETYGAVIGMGLRIAGLFRHDDPDQPPYFEDVVSATLVSRRACRGHLPHAFLSISDDGTDFSYYLDCSAQTPDGDCPAVVLGPGADNVVIAATFSEFVLRLARDDFDY